MVAGSRSSRATRSKKVSEQGEIGAQRQSRTLGQQFVVHVDLDGQSADPVMLAVEGFNVGTVFIRESSAQIQNLGYRLQTRGNSSMYKARRRSIRTRTSKSKQHRPKMPDVERARGTPTERYVFSTRKTPTGADRTVSEKGSGSFRKKIARSSAASSSSETNCLA